MMSMSTTRPMKWIMPSRSRLMGLPFDDEEQGAATVQSREGDEVHHPEVDADEDREAQQIFETLLGDLADHADGAHRAHDIVGALAPEEQVAQEGD